MGSQRASTSIARGGPRLTAFDVAHYRREGFVRVQGVLTPEEVDLYRDAAERCCSKQPPRVHPDSAYARVFTQIVNVWQHDEVLRQLTLHPTLAVLATQLAGVPLRLWHDHLLVKPPHNDAPTQFHQDRPYWPHAASDHSLSAWVALVDVPPERGCMTFIAGSHNKTGLRPQDLRNPEDLFAIAPDLRWHQRVTVPLRSGDCTFHHSYTAHMATSNATDEARFAHVVIYMDAGTTYTGKAHQVTDPLALEVGSPLDGPLFPAMPSDTLQP